jgi:hypothetical protein
MVTSDHSKSLERNSSPDRLLSLKFQEVSPENPFRGRSNSNENESRRRTSREGQQKLDPMRHYKAKFDKITNISPE